MRNTIFDEDKLLVKAAGTPSENKPRFDWAQGLGDNRFEVPKVRITDGAGDRDFHIAELADVIGEALTNLMISREENEIYTPKNRELVVESARIVADRLIERMAEEEEGGAPRLSFDELYRLIEKALVENELVRTVHGWSRTVNAQESFELGILDLRSTYFSVRYFTSSPWSLTTFSAKLSPFWEYVLYEYGSLLPICSLASTHFVDWLTQLANYCTLH
mgnify:CR=1 FL=1